MSELPRRAPRVTAETEPFWSAAAAHRLVLPRCGACCTVFWYPRAVCPMCGSFDVAFVEAAGTGEVYSFTVVRSGSGPYLHHSPYVVALVELDEGVRLLSNVVGVPPGEVHVGMRVTVVFDEVTVDGEFAGAIPRFAPVGSPA